MYTKEFPSKLSLNTNNLKLLSGVTPPPNTRFCKVNVYYTRDNLIIRYYLYRLDFTNKYCLEVHTFLTCEQLLSPLSKKEYDNLSIQKQTYLQKTAETSIQAMVEGKSILPQFHDTDTKIIETNDGAKETPIDIYWHYPKTTVYREELHEILRNQLNVPYPVLLKYGADYITFDPSNPQILLDALKNYFNET